MDKTEERFVKLKYNIDNILYDNLYNKEKQII